MFTTLAGVNIPILLLRLIAAWNLLPEGEGNRRLRTTKRSSSTTMTLNAQ